MYVKAILFSYTISMNKIVTSMWFHLFGFIKENRTEKKAVTYVEYSNIWGTLLFQYTCCLYKQVWYEFTHWYSKINTYRRKRKNAKHMEFHAICSNKTETRFFIMSIQPTKCVEAGHSFGGSSVRWRHTIKCLVLYFFFSFVCYAYYIHPSDTIRVSWFTTHFTLSSLFFVLWLLLNLCRKSLNIQNTKINFMWM